ncbi:zinc-dependent alcohol dehydrogenase family protein [Streptomyces olivaceus]|uniref:zinc-dependent alcohol dehydrogenase family protein n=2 Tax=Streptomyces olivaceus TaxID=47716 RepID=UPI0004C4A34D|nr:zinc-dependent alcohol dehydrogenase family protein [Streptomyces olivaceus]MBZ6100999.1 zinc-dependent alcohol dehydrogenase family protein [Streptomyces olivaceus]
MPRVVVFDEFGGPEVMHVVEEPVVEPAAGEVRVRIEAFALNPLDRMMRAGTSPATVPLPHARLGIEGTGVVDALGPGATGLEVGDPVVLAAVPDPSARGSYAEYTTVPASQVVARPAGLAVTEAAAVWVGYSTAYGALVEKAGMRPGDHVLVTAASGGVGRAALQVARQIGAVPLAVTRHTANRDDLLAAGAAAVVATDRADVVEAVRHHTGGAGADIVLDLVRGPGQQDLLRAARPGGTLVAAGFLDPRPTPSPTGTPLRVFSYRSFEHTLDAVVVRRMAAFLNAGVRLGALRPAVGEVFALDDIVEAHRHLERGLHAGKKIVVTVQERRDAR